MSALNYLDSFEWLENLALGSDILYLTAQCFNQRWRLHSFSQAESIATVTDKMLHAKYKSF